MAQRGDLRRGVAMTAFTRLGQLGSIRKRGAPMPNGDISRHSFEGAANYYRPTLWHAPPLGEVDHPRTGRSPHRPLDSRNPVARDEDLGRTGQGIEDTVEHITAHQNESSHLSASSHRHPSDPLARAFLGPPGRIRQRPEDASCGEWP